MLNVSAIDQLLITVNIMSFIMHTLNNNNNNIKKGLLLNLKKLIIMILFHKKKKKLKIIK